MDNEDVHLHVEGHHATLDIYDDYVVIERGGVMATLSFLEDVGSKEIPIEEITGVKSFENRIRLNQDGQPLSDSSIERDLNTIEKSDTDAEVIREVIRERKRALGADNGGDGDEKDSALETLRQRFAEGEISKDEFEQKREMLE
jgi:hypothetical protein